MTKIQVYWTVVFTTLYGADTWVACRSHIRLLKRFHQRCLNIRWIGQMLKFWSMLRSPALKLYYCSTSSDEQDMSPEWWTIFCQWLPLMVGCPLAKGREAPKKRYKDCLTKSLTACHVDPLCWSDMAADRDTWRHLIFNVSEFEHDRRNAQIKGMQKESSSCVKHNTGCYLHLWTQLTTLPFPHRARQCWLLAVDVDRLHILCLPSHYYYYVCLYIYTGCPQKNVCTFSQLITQLFVFT